MAPPEQKALKRLAKLGVSNFETIADARQRQADMLRRLEQVGIDAGYYAGLDDCEPNHCGRLKCTEACWFGIRRRRLTEIALVYQLLQQCQAPLYEVRIIRESWQRPIGKLQAGSIAAAKQFNRRRLDTLYYPTVVAIGTYKATIAPRHVGARWITEIHEIVGGVEQEELERIYSVKRALPGFSNNIFWAKAVTDLAPTINDVLRRDLPLWQHPYSKQLGPRANKTERAEFYAWLLRLNPEERLIRYGCDKYFNRLVKKPRIYRAKLKRKRPYPFWLQPYMYDTHDVRCKCNVCIHRQG
jgi:hypothetical protein